MGGSYYSVSSCVWRLSRRLKGNGYREEEQNLVCCCLVMNMISSSLHDKANDITHIYD